jgi:assimilatory nitrate reductase catalytic subunit
LSDFNIFKLIARAWGCGELFLRWSSPEASFQILKALSAGQPCDITGIADYAHLDAEGGIQWPLKEPTALRERRLFADGKFFHPDGRARLLFDLPREVAEPTDASYPFTLLSGRGTSAQWHTGSRTNKSALLRSLAPENCYIELHPADAAHLGIAPQAQVRVSSRRASLRAAAFITATIQPGQVFIPMHYPEVNRLTNPSFDPHSRQPSYKHCAVNIGPA